MAQTLNEALDVERLYQPLTILRDVSKRLLQRQIPNRPNLLDELYAHIFGAVGDAIDYANDQLEVAKEALLSATEEMAAEGSTGARARQALTEFDEEFEQAQAEMREALELAKETFFSATSFQELQARQGHLDIVESRLETALQVMESALTRLDHPDLAVPYVATAAQVPQALSQLALGLDLIQSHLEQGERATLEAALEHVKAAQALLQEALAESAP